MQLQYFGFQEEPFSVTPDPRYLYPSSTHYQALASLKQGFADNRGFIALVAPPGMGKTTLLFQFLEDIRDSARSAFLFHIDPECEPREIISYILRDIGIIPGEDSAARHEQLNTAVAAEARRGRRLIVVIDEAQHLSDGALEVVRMLTNFETSRSKLMQIVLAGQPELLDKLMKPSMLQLRQRISTFCRIEPLNREQTRAYINHRLKVAGYSGDKLFTAEALDQLADASQGIPRIINNLCFQALSRCCFLKRKQVDAGIAAEVIAEPYLRLDTLETPVAEHESAVVPFIRPESRSLGAGLKPWVVAVVALGIVGLMGIRPRHTADAHALDTHVLGTSGLEPSALAATAAAEPSASSARPRAAPLAVSVKRNESLGDLAMQYLGGFDQDRLRQIQKLNPKLTNPDHIEIGQTILLPAR
jgi:type II secretory pathway predicted ATPase ExeA